jgi:hypothetical protein
MFPVHKTLSLSGRHRPHRRLQLACPGSGACTVTMDKAKTVKATFEKPKTTAGPDRIEVYGESGEEESEPESG